MAGLTEVNLPPFGVSEPDPVLRPGKSTLTPVFRAVDGLEEAGAAIVAALHEVLRHAGRVDAWLSWHGVERVFSKGPCSTPTHACEIRRSMHLG